MKIIGTILIAVAAVAVAVVLAIPGGASSQPSVGLNAAQVVGVAQAEAAAAGEAHPTGTSVSHGTLREVMMRLNPEVNDIPVTPATSVPVTLVLMHGSFVLRQAKVPAGRPLPSGNVMAVIVETSTGAVIGRALPAELPAIAGAARAGDGTVIGRVLLAGGPHRSGKARYADRVSVSLRRDGGVARLTRTNSRGSFGLHLTPGTYDVAARLASGQQCPSHRVAVGRNARRFVDLSCTIR